MAPRLIHLYPFDLQRPDLNFVGWLGAQLARVLNVIAVEHADIPLPHDGRREGHAEWSSHRLVEAVIERGEVDGTLPGEWLLGIAAVDLFAPQREFVFGEAELGGSCAVVSLARLREPNLPDDTQVVRDRLLRESLHEIGHLSGIDHCAQGSCVMQMSRHPDDIDRKPAAFCSDCARLIDAL